MKVKVTSEIAGQVWKVVANVGDALAADDVIIILESMKMEIPILAPRAGTLAALHVGAEDMVSEDQTVAELDVS
ncbi:MAG: acetyl-CoA carboxylase biotin carboxyl carrier protein subunit [Rhizobiales bacterium TMED83]|jgi:acetyl-CoA carboxylase biotin carboxyl carrier protein|nr:acetyl-CoA carboxylase biotin carboxyl carrier protein subunit [Rhodobiaceae bacterium]RPF93141.1 MAG: acetyl-CoA carboxylase biotin carboxyl carrier protein subunit [Rhizobiales bacterium TMED83]HCD16908.1 acetyl-CoA carboxylase biotin carboxyl carrier protein subunit [Rhodobiaceae bacterium]